MTQEGDKNYPAFKHFMEGYKVQWDLNQPYREYYDEELETYLSYRPKERYPLQYSEFFNKLLPKTQTILSRFMDQLYQAGTSDLVSVRPRKRGDVERAKRVSGLLNYQLECLNDIDMQGGSYFFNFQWMFNAINFGTGIAKGYWRKEERVMPRRIQVPVPQFDQRGNLVGMGVEEKMIEDKQVAYDGPYAEVMHNKLCVPHPLYKNIQKMPFFFVVYPRSIDYLKSMRDKGVYSGIKDLGWNSASSKSSSNAGEDTYEAYSKSIEIDGGILTEQLNSERSTPMVDVIEGYGRYIFPEDESAYEVGSGVKIKGRESEAIIHIGNYKTVLKVQKNKYGYRPFFDIHAYYNPEIFWSIGILRLGKGIQEQYNTLANTRLQNAMMGVNQMLKVNSDWDGDPASLIWKPFGLIPVDDMDEIQPLIAPDMSQTGLFREQEQFFDAALEEMTGMYKYNMGATPQRQEHVGTIYSLQSMGEARTKLLLMTMDHQGFRPFLKYLMLLNLFHLPSGFEARINTNEGDAFVPMFAGDIHVNYDFSARYTAMEPALGKQYRAQQLIQWAQLWAQSPYLQHYQFIKAVMEMMDFHDADKYLLSPEQVAQQQQAQEAKMIESQVMAMQMQEKMDANKDKRKYEGEITKEIVKAGLSDPKVSTGRSGRSSSNRGRA